MNLSSLFTSEKTLNFPKIFKATTVSMLDFLPANSYMPHTEAAIWRYQNIQENTFARPAALSKKRLWYSVFL